MITDAQRDDASLALLEYLLGMTRARGSLSHDAANWLGGGADTPGIVALAGLSSNASEWELRDRALAALEELGTPSPDEPEQLEPLLTYLAQAILNDLDRAEEYSKLIWRLAQEHYDDARIQGLDELLGLASSWDEPYADQLPQALKDAAIRYLNARH